MTYYDGIKAAASSSLPWGKLSNCNILITGASGLIGSSLVEILLEKPHHDYQVYALGRNKLRMERLFKRYDADNSFHILTADVTQRLAYDIPFHYIVHAASGAGPADFAQRPVEVITANIQGVQNLIEYGKDHAMKRFLYVSSGEVYGEGDGRIFTEDYCGYVNSTSPRSCYPSSKRAAETLCVSYASEYGVDVVIVRPSHTYGPGFTENDSRVYAQFIRNVLKGEDIIMKSTGEQFRSWCYVIDCASGILYVLLKGENCEAYNIADTTSNITIKELAEMVADIGGKKVVIENPDEKERSGYNVVKKSVFAIDKLQSLGWSVTGTMREKMKSTIIECMNNEKGTYVR